MRFGVLGPLEVWDGDQQLEVGGPQQRALLAVLLLNANRVVSADRLVGHLWGEEPPATARSLLQGCVAGLRRALHADHQGSNRRLVTRAPGYQLRVGPGELDLQRFEELVRAAGTAWEAGSRAGLAEAAGRLAEALALWRGPALDGIELDSYRGEVVQLEERRLAALERRVDIDLWLGRQGRLIGELQVLVETHPHRERLWAQLMLALYLADRRADALATYWRLREALVEQLGTDPGEAVQQLHRAILTGGEVRSEYLRARGLPDRPAPEPAWRVPAQLPAVPAGFTGRARQLERLDSLLSGAGHRVVVISGMAGVGKTTLTVSWAQRVRDRFPDGQLYVNLRGYGSPSPVRSEAALARFLQAIGFPAEQVPVDPEEAAGQYRSLLADRRVLVVLDNAASIEQVRPLLPGGSGCLVLVTSRERLAGLVAIEGALHVSLEVLDLGEAVELLARIAGEPRVRAEPAPAAELARLCGFLPLALRVAAANLALEPHLSVAEHAAQLAAGDRLAALAVDQDEQTAVRAAFDHSYAALPTDARRVLRLLGLVPGPHVTADAVAALAGTGSQVAAGLLRRLASAHLLDQPAPGRYTLHDLVRLYAAGRARDEESAGDRQAATGRLFGWYLHSTDAAVRLLSPDLLRLPLPDPPQVSPATFDDHRQAFGWLEAERANVLAIVQHAAEHGPYPVAYHLADALQSFYILRPYPVERLAIAHAGLAAARSAGDIRAEAVVERSLGNAWEQQRQHQRAAGHYQRSVVLSERAGWVEAHSTALNCLGNSLMWTRRLAEASDRYQRALALNRQVGWLPGQGVNLGNLGIVSLHLGDLRQAADYSSEALVLFGRMEARGKEALALGNLGEVRFMLGRLDDAADDLTRALAMDSEFGATSNRSDIQRSLASVHRDAGRYPQAMELAQAALASAREVADRRFECEALTTLGTVYHRLGQYREALGHLEQALRLARETEDRSRTVAALIEITAAQHQLDRGDEATDAIHEALELARDNGYRIVEGNALTVLAAIDLAAGRIGEAVAHAEQAIAIQQHTGHRLGEARARRELGNAHHRSGDTEAAAACWQRASALFAEIGSPEADEART